MTEAEHYAILSKVDAALEVYRVAEGPLTPKHVRTQRLLQLIREQVAEDLEEMRQSLPSREYPLTP